MLGNAAQKTLHDMVDLPLFSCQALLMLLSTAFGRVSHLIYLLCLIQSQLLFVYFHPNPDVDDNDCLSRTSVLGSAVFIHPFLYTLQVIDHGSPGLPEVHSYCIGIFSTHHRSECRHPNGDNITFPYCQSIGIYINISLVFALDFFLFYFAYFKYLESLYLHFRNCNNHSVPN